jgi:DNA end-binding protein Ku
MAARASSSRASSRAASKSHPSARASADSRPRKAPARSSKAANDDSASSTKSKGTGTKGSGGARGGASRVLWKGAITFGLVLVPVELHTATRKQGLELDMLDKRSMEPIGYKRINKISGKEVPWENIVKGYEYEKGQYVVLGDEDFKRANPKATQSVEIFAFVDAAEIPSMYFDTPYYLVPQRTGVKVYALLMQAMEKENCVALANVVIATKQHLAVVIPDGEKLMLNTLRYADEIRDTENLNMPDVAGASIKAGEMAMAQKLIDSMRGKWEPEEYHDTYREDLMARIDEKVKAGQLNEVPKAEKGEGEPRQRSAEVIDLMSLLKQSIPGGKGKGRAAAEDDEDEGGRRPSRSAAKGAARKTVKTKAAPRKRAA